MRQSHWETFFAAIVFGTVLVLCITVFKETSQTEKYVYAVLTGTKVSK